MKKVESNKDLVAACGLYCGSCFAYLKEKCPGCRENEKANWCKVRSCCGKKSYETCADCETFKEADQCPKFNSFISKLLGCILNSDRNACVKRIRQIGVEEYSREMAQSNKRTIKKRK